LKVKDAARWLSVVVPGVVVILHSSLFWDWIVDDAAISFSFAKNLAEGHGLVCQAGAAPIEGYSNPLWVLLFTPFFCLGLFDLIITPKVLSGILVIATFVITHRTISSLPGGGNGAALVVLLLAAVNTSFAVWTSSGLENPLYVFLLSLLMYLSVQSITLAKAPKGMAVALGLVAGAVTLTRPDGILFFPAYPLALLVVWLAERKRFQTRSVMTNLLLYTGAFAAVFAGLLVFRLLYFGDLLPNTYYAKGGPSLRDVASLMALRPRMVSRIQAPMTSVAGPFGNLVLVGLIVLTVHLISTKRFAREHVVLASFLAFAAFDYLLLPDDWMTEFRFATPFIFFFFWYAVVIVNVFIGTLRLRRISSRLVGVSLAVLVIGVSLPAYVERSSNFAKDPAVPFDAIAERVGHRFNEYAGALGVQQGSLLTPDMGGALWYSKLKVYDLGMLCDRTIARTLRKDQQAFYDYVFETVKPTFIHVHGGWTFLAALDDDPRFRRDYIPIHERPETWAKGMPGEGYSGDYVRKDAVQGNLEAFRQLQSEFESEVE